MLTILSLLCRVVSFSDLGEDTWGVTSAAQLHVITRQAIAVTEAATSAE